MRNLKRIGITTLAVAGAATVLAAPASAKIVSKTFTQCISGGTILDNQATAAAFNVPVPKNGKKEQPGIVTGVSVGLRLTHTSNADLIVGLVGPGGGAVNLVSFVGGSSNGYGTGPGCGGSPVTFSDSALTLISDAPDPNPNPFVGSFRPQEPLASFNGGPARGAWSLVVFDFAEGDQGLVDGATLNLTYAYNKAKKKKGRKKKK
jgi:subtilisin-like proprotein convertase family protein